MIPCRTDLDKNIFDFDLLLPHLHFVGNYKIAMRILLLNIHGNGGLTGNFSKAPTAVTRSRWYGPVVT